MPTLSAGALRKVTLSNARHQAAYRARQRDMLEEILAELRALRQDFEALGGLRINPVIINGATDETISPEVAEALLDKFLGSSSKALRKAEGPAEAPSVLPPEKVTPTNGEPPYVRPSELRPAEAEAPSGLLDMDASGPGEVARCQACRTPYLYVPPEPWECCGARDFVEDSLAADEIAVAVPV